MPLEELSFPQTLGEINPGLAGLRNQRFATANPSVGGSEARSHLTLLVGSRGSEDVREQADQQALDSRSWVRESCSR
jgi:hypothetical protein